MSSFASLDADDIGQICQLGLGKNLGLLKHDFNHNSKVEGEMLLFLRGFSSLLSSDGDPWDHGCCFSSLDVIEIE